MFLSVSYTREEVFSTEFGRLSRATFTKTKGEINFGPVVSNIKYILYLKLISYRNKHHEDADAKTKWRVM